MVFGTTQPTLFGATAATSAQPATTSIFGAAPTTTQPSAPSLFGATAATSAQPATTSIFGAAPTTTQPSAPSFFGAPSSTSTAQQAAPSLFGKPAATTTTQQPSLSLFGAPAATTTTQPAATSLFGAPSSTTTAPLFGASTTATQPSIFGAPTATSAQPATTSIFGTAPATTQANTGLGGAQKTTFGAAGTLGGPQATNQPDVNPKDGEVPAPLLSEFDTLKKAMKENQRLAEEFRIASNSENTEILKVDDEINAVRVLLFQQKSAVQKFRLKTRALMEKVKMDLRMAEQAHQRSESMGKNPRHGHQQAIQYMHGIVDQYEKNLVESKELLAKLEDIIVSILDRDENAKQITQKELSEHLERFDKIFRAVTFQVHNTDAQVQELKDIFLDQRRRISRFAPNPFEKRKDTIREQDPYTTIKGLDPFPSQTALMELSEYLPKTNVPTATGAPAFGSTASSLFAPKPTPFSFPSSTTQPSLFSKPFGTTTTTAAPSLFSNTTTPLFGNASNTGAKRQLLGGTSSSTANLGTTGGTQPTGAAATTTTTAPATMPTFGSTLSSSSGTLFGGSATKPSLFGK